MKKIFSIFGILLGIAYLLNIGAGVIELIPDNLPYIGNLDEVGAVLLIVKCLKNLGVSFNKNKEKNDSFRSK